MKEISKVSKIPNIDPRNIERSSLFSGNFHYIVNYFHVKFMPVDFYDVDQPCIL